MLRKPVTLDSKGWLDWLQGAQGAPVGKMRPRGPLKPILTECPNCRHLFAANQERRQLNFIMESGRALNLFDIDIAGRWGAHPGMMMSIKSGTESSDVNHLADLARLAKPEVAVYQSKLLDCDAADLHDAKWEVHTHYRP